MNALLNSLNEGDLAILRETERDRLAELDEDDLVELHTRVRRARDKYVKLYRRQASARVEELGGRGTARPKNRRNAGRAEVFEDALARVSRQLAAAARHSAALLKAQRLEEARRERNTSPHRPQGSIRPTAMTAQRTSLRPDSPAMRKRHASTLATGARRQARRDSR
jgi:hypothetical protein